MSGPDRDGSEKRKRLAARIVAGGGRPTQIDVDAADFIAIAVLVLALGAAITALIVAISMALGGIDAKIGGGVLVGLVGGGVLSGLAGVALRRRGETPADTTEAAGSEDETR